MAGKSEQEQFAQFVDRLNKEVNDNSPIKFECPECRAELYTITEFTGQYYISMVMVAAYFGDLGFQSVLAMLPVPSDVKEEYDWMNKFRLLSDSVIKATEEYDTFCDESATDDQGRCEGCGYPVVGEGDANIKNIT